MAKQGLQDELEQLEGKVKVQFGRWMQPATDEQWRAAFGEMTLTKLYERFARVAGPDNHIHIAVEISDPEQAHAYQSLVTVHHNPHPDKEDDLMDCAQFGLIRDGYASVPNCGYMPWALIQSQDQGKHLAKSYMREAVEVLRDLGVEQIEMRAEKIGAYAWAKYGFTPVSEREWADLRSLLKRRIGEDGTAFTFEDETYDISAEMPVISRILDADYADLPHVFPQLTALNRVIGEREGKPLTVGKALLIDRRWEGKLPMDEDHPSYQRFQSYTASTPQRTQETGRG